ncbi:MAG: hypothetical protein IJT94_08110 [Oscillibacter sp.]|nr:hypothetical protein [Oscillibacter sp.]
MARKKKDEPGKGGIIQLKPGKQSQETLWDGVWDEGDWDEDEDGWDEEEMPEELMTLMSRIMGGGSGGMTDTQFKSMLVDQRENWKRIQRIAKEEQAENTVKAIQEQIKLINEKLKY